MKFRVHMFERVRKTFEVEAENSLAAAQKVDKALEFDRQVQTGGK